LADDLYDHATALEYLMWKSMLPDADMQAVPRALLRAARRARKIAYATKTPLVIVRDGVMVERDDHRSGGLPGRGRG
jgi:hypothetical protein